MKKHLLPLLVLLLTTLSTHAYDFQSGDLYYNITGENTVEVTYPESNYRLTNATIPETVTNEGTTYSVIGIGDGAFSRCSYLTSVSLPNSVTRIGDNAFYKCTSLTSINIPNYLTNIGNEAFYKCTSLTSINIPNSVTMIGSLAFYGCTSLPIFDNIYYADTYLVGTVDDTLDAYTIKEGTKWIGSGAFRYCSSLTSITIPYSVTSIGEQAFYRCSALTSITISNSVTSIESSAFSDCSSLTQTNYTGDIMGWCAIHFGNATANPIYYSGNLYVNGALVTDLVISEGVTNIGNYAFSGCSAITSISFPESVTDIGDGAFSGCSALTSISIPHSVTSIGGSAFSGCSALTSVTIPNSVTSIGSSTFSGCSSLTSVTIPNSVTSIGGGAFYGCSSLTSISIPHSVTSIGGSAFRGCSSLTSITIPNSVTSIGGGAFRDCSSLTSINIGNSIKNIENYTFYSCNSLKSVTIPNSVKTIGEYAFSNCGLLSITIPDSVTNIGNYAFQYCNSLASITFGLSLNDIGYCAFQYCNDLTSVTSMRCTPPYYGFDVFPLGIDSLVVPNSSMEKYKNKWGKYFSNLYSLRIALNVLSANKELGRAQIDQERDDCDGTAIVSAVGNLGYSFTQWTDGNTDNPRTVLITQDTTFTAEFGLAYSGKCGDDLYWAYSNKEVKIIGSGAMYNYTDSTMPWTLLRDSIKTVRVGNNATSISEYAFANTPKLAELYIGANVEDIGANAFAGCKRLYDIYCYPIEPPFAQSNSFANYNVYVYVPCENQRDYTLDVVWGEFKFIECIGSEDVVVTDDEVVVAPSYEDVTITWPVVSGADTYSLVLTKEGDTFCTLVFNAQGQLVSIAFKPRRQNAPAEEGTTPATYAEMTANGFRFTVTGLDEGTDYAYTLTVRNASNSVLETYTGEFTTLSNTPTGISDRPDTTGTVSDKGAEKLLRNGQVLIIRNGDAYDMMGQKL